MNKQPQTCYVESGERCSSKLKPHLINGMSLDMLSDRYIFTKEELEAHDIEMHNYYLQEMNRAKSNAEWYKRQYDNLMKPFFEEGIF